MTIGFTGTQRGLSLDQRGRLGALLCGHFNPLNGKNHFRHGDCVGADHEAAVIAQSIGYYIISHPPLNQSKRCFFESDFHELPKPYLQRNKNIVDCSDIIIACPRTSYMILRSGTWSTIRYAQKKGIHVEIIA